MIEREKDIPAHVFTRNMKRNIPEEDKFRDYCDKIPDEVILWVYIDAGAIDGVEITTSKVYELFAKAYFYKKNYWKLHTPRKDALKPRVYDILSTRINALYKLGILGRESPGKQSSWYNTSSKKAPNEKPTLDEYNFPENWDEICQTVDATQPNAKPFEEPDWMRQLPEAGPISTPQQKQTECRYHNLIVTGIPGSGKSHYIQKIIIPEYGISKTFRTVFHGEYTNTDFIGQMMPDEKGGYMFNPGPFTRALKHAINSGERTALVIEEINRGNAAAIFGEIFQLIDRNEGGDGTYAINSPSIATYVCGDPEAPIKIPKTLFIFCTMNTNDQNVFTLDTAFRRRWNIKYLHRQLPLSSNAEYILKMYVPGTDVLWKDFRTAMNSLIVSSSLINSEDKQMGLFFVSKMELSDNPNEGDDDLKEDFAGKVIGYLWSIVSRSCRDDIFKKECKTLGKTIVLFSEKWTDVFSEKALAAIDKEKTTKSASASNSTE